MSILEIISLIILFVTLGINIFLVFLVYIRNPSSATHKLFTFLGISLSIWLGVFYISSQPESQNILFWMRLSLFFASLMSSAFYLFAKVLPQNIFKINKVQLSIFVAITGFVMFLTITPFVFERVVYLNNVPNPIVAPGIIIFLIYVILINATGVYELYKKFKNSTGLEKSQFSLIMLGVLIMHGLLITTITIPVAISKQSSFIVFVPIYASIFIFLTAYAILKHRFLDIKLIVVRAVAYLLLVFFIGLGYIALLFDLAIIINKEVPTRQTVQDLIIPALLAVVFAISFQPLRRFFERVTDRFFYKDHYDSNDLLWELSRIMASTLDLSEICKKILDRLLAAMRVSYGSIVLVRKSSIIWVGSAGRTSGAPFKGNDIYHLIHESYKPHGGSEQVLIYEELPEGKLKNVMREHAITLVLPLIVREELIGGILLGEKSSGEIYSSEDIDLLKILTPEVAVAVKNSLSFEEIKRFNITLEEEVKHATERLRNANHKLKELDSLKDEFVSIASHELRTPMTAIKSYLWMSLNQPGQPIKEPLKKYLNISYSSTERLIRLVNDMLTVSRIERNKVELKLAPVDISEIAKAVYDELKITADERKIHLTLNKAEDIKYMVNGDREKLREVFQNIVGNALKFTPADGSIKIQIEKQGNMLRTAVTDTGPGIAKDSMSLLFKKFSKIEYSYAKHSNQPGTGLGLYISKQIVSLHNGDIQVQSEVDVGTTFTVLLPSIKNSPEVKKD